MERHVITASTLVVVVVVIMLLCSSGCRAEKLSPDQKAPLFAKGSGGLILKAPFEGGAADVGQRRAQTNSAPPVTSPAGAPQVDGVVREETEELKEVDGQLVRVVKGNFAYASPEGLPIAVKFAAVLRIEGLDKIQAGRYIADENGNRASFTFGTGKPSSGSRLAGDGSKLKKPGLTPGGPGATSLGGGGSDGKGGRQGGSGGGSGGSGGRPAGSAGGGGSSRGDVQNGASTYLPPTTKVDRSYLPPN